MDEIMIKYESHYKEDIALSKLMKLDNEIRPKNI